MKRKPVDTTEPEMRRRQLAERSWTLAEMYLQPLLPPYDEQVAIAAGVEQASADINCMRAAGLSYHVARRIYIGLPPYPSPELVAKWGSPTFEPR